MHEVMLQGPVLHHQECPSESGALLQAVARDVQHLLAFVGLNMQGMRKILKKVKLQAFRICQRIPCAPVAISAAARGHLSHVVDAAMAWLCQCCQTAAALALLCGNIAAQLALRVADLHAAWQPELSACQLPLPLLPAPF